jgi:pimeloyl-ACP methyl ester carboxylesterase
MNWFLKGKIYLIVLTLFTGAVSCRNFRVLKNNLGEQKDNVERFDFFGNDRAKLPVWIKGQTNSKYLVVFLAGGPGSPALDYRAQLLDLEKEFLLCYYDQRGAGFSKSKRSNLDLDNFIWDLETLVNILVKKYPEKKIVLFGHSWGGFLGINYLSKNENQNRISGWIEMDGGHNFPLLFSASKNEIVTLAKSKIDHSKNDSVKGVWANMYDEVINQNPSELNGAMSINRNAYKTIKLLKLPRDEATKSAKRKFLVNFKFAANSDKVQENTVFGNDLIKASVSENMAAIKIPVLLIWGKQDVVSPPITMLIDAMENLKCSIRVDTLLVNHAGHTPTLYKGRSEVIHKVVKFIKEL